MNLRSAIALQFLAFLVVSSFSFLCSMEQQPVKDCVLSCKQSYSYTLRVKIDELKEQLQIISSPVIRKKDVLSLEALHSNLKGLKGSFDRLYNKEILWGRSALSDNGICFLHAALIIYAAIGEAIYKNVQQLTTLELADPSDSMVEYERLLDSFMSWGEDALALFEHCHKRRVEIWKAIAPFVYGQIKVDFVFASCKYSQRLWNNFLMAVIKDEDKVKQLRLEDAFSRMQRLEEEPIKAYL